MKTKTKSKKKVVKPKKKVVKKPKKKVVAKKKSVGKSHKEGKLVGQVKHYYSSIKVAIIKVKMPIKQGDTLRIVGGETTDFKQKVMSMQLNYKSIKMAKKGSSIGLKVSQIAREGYKVFKV